MSSLKGLIENINNKGKTTREYLTISGEGHYIIRVLPNLDDENEAPFEDFMLHWFFHPYYQREANIRCIGHNCPLCNYAKEVERKDKQAGWKLKAKQLFIYNVIDRKDGRLKVLKVYHEAHEAIKSKLIEGALDEVNLAHIKTGRDIELEVRKVNDKTRYKGHILSSMESKPVSPKVIQELKFVKPLSEMYKLSTREELLDIVKGKVPDLPKTESKRVTSKASLIENLNKKNPTKPTVSETISAPKDNEEPKSLVSEKLKKLDIFDDKGDGNE